MSVLLQSKGPHGRGNPHCRRGGGAGGKGGKGGDGSTAGNACDSSLAVTDDEEDEEEDIFCQCDKVSSGLFDVMMFLCFLFMAPPVKVIALLSCFGEPEVLSTRWDNQHCSYM